jgi:zinc transporter
LRARTANDPHMPPVKAPEIAYGSDKNGLVWAYQFAPGMAPCEIDSESITNWLAAPAGADSSGFVWLHFSLSNTGAERWLRQSLQLPDGFYESLRESVGSTRLEQAGDALVAVIHDVMFDTSFDSSSVSTVTLGVTPRLVVSARLRPLRSVDRLRAAVRAGQTFRSTAELLAHLLRDQAEVLVEIVRRSTSRVDAIEDRLLANRVSISRAELSTLRRTLVRLQRLLAPEPAAMFRLLSKPAGWVKEEDQRDLRQAAEEFSAAVADATALAERVKLLQEELIAQVNEQTGRTLFVLTIVTVLALPINLIAGLFGMNVGGIPFSQVPHGFVVVVGGTILMTASLAYLAYRLLNRNRN